MICCIPPPWQWIISGRNSPYSVFLMKQRRWTESGRSFVRHWNIVHCIPTARHSIAFANRRKINWRPLHVVIPPSPVMRKEKYWTCDKNPYELYHSTDRFNSTTAGEDTAFPIIRQLLTDRGTDPGSALFARSATMMPIDLWLISIRGGAILWWLRCLTITFEMPISYRWRIALLPCRRSPHGTDLFWSTAIGITGSNGKLSLRVALPVAGKRFQHHTLSP